MPLTESRRPAQHPLTFQQLLFRLQSFWAERGCVLQQPYDVEVGAGTMSPDTFLRVLGPTPVAIAYAQPSRRPADGRYGENPNRLFKHTQFQVILKPPPTGIQEIYLESLAAIGIDLREHDLKFEEDNWESPTLGAWGIGWQVMLDGLEITQFTYFQQCGGIDLDPISGEITYGLERIAAFLQDVDSIYDIIWAVNPVTGQPTTYGEVRLLEELQFSVYNFEAADVEKLWEHLRLYESEAQALLAEFKADYAPEAAHKAQREGKIHNRLIHEAPETTTSDSKAAQPASREASNSAPAGTLKTQEAPTSSIDAGLGSSEPDLPTKRRRFPVLPAYDLCLKCSHLFNLLDARGAISVTERVGVIARIRNLAVAIAQAYNQQQSK